MHELAWPGDSIVVVEDDRDVREAIVDLLRFQDYEVVAFEDGARALEYLSGCTTPPALILLDLMMPVMDGWQFRVEQKKSPALSATPVIVLTADTSPQASAIDADAVLHKPFKTADLLQLVKTTLQAVHRDRLARVERMISLGTLVAGIAHEINNPLTYVISNLEYLDQQLKCGPERAILTDFAAPVSEALEGAQRVRAVIEQVHRFGTRGSGQKPVSAERAAEAAIKLVENQIRQRARLVRNYQPSPPASADENALVQVLVNLFMNAVQAIPEGRVEEHVVGISVRPDGADRVRIEVSDTGGGMADDVKRRMFEPFYGSQQSDQNSGLGLSLSYATVRSWGGDIAIQSEPGAGTRVSVVLPRAAGDEPVVAGSQAPLPTRKARVLVVDDEPAILRSLARVLGEHEVVTSSSAHEALAILQQDETFDVVLCDLMMPGVTGADLHRTIRSLRPGLEDRFVFMTGGVITPSVERFVSETSCSFVAKPFDTKALRALVAERLASEES